MAIRAGATQHSIQPFLIRRWKLQAMKPIRHVVIILSLLSLSFAVPNYYRDSHWCGRGTEFLEDSKCAKVFPSQYDRSPSSACPVLAQSAPAIDGWQRDTGHFSDFRINTTAFEGVGISSNLCVTLVRRVDGDGVYYRHLCGAQVQFQHVVLYQVLIGQIWTLFSNAILANSMPPIRNSNHRTIRTIIPLKHGRPQRSTQLPMRGVTCMRSVATLV